ncbi:MAG: hypothetical protein KC731_09055, partial [Myxococcales bacterium]|nr:hypothetical protein [Myxococcales bacterium]
AKADPHSAEASFDVVLSLLRFAELAQEEGDLDALCRAVTTANERLDAMDGGGQITGHQQRESVREFLRNLAQQLATNP